MPPKFVQVPSAPRALRFSLRFRRILRCPAVLQLRLEIGFPIIHEVHRLSERDEETDGIYLYTGSEENVALYKRFGYTLVDTVEGKGFRAYHMYRKHMIEGWSLKER